jgi:hypothetical protein
MNGPQNRSPGNRREELDVQSLGLHASQGQSAPAPRKKRSWWLYLLIAAGSLLLMVLLALVLLAGYVKSMVTNYTAPAPRTFPRVEFDSQAQKELENRWTEFARAVQARQAPVPFIITADEINMALSKDQQMRDRVHVIITNSRVLVEFCVPLDQVGWQYLKGRYVNGVARVDLSIKGGKPNFSIGSVEANGRPLRGRIVTWFRQETAKNLNQILEQNRDTVNVFQGIESLQVEGSSIVVTPVGPAR